MGYFGQVVACPAAMVRPNPRVTGLLGFLGRWIALSLAVPLCGAFQPSHAATILSYISSPYSWVGRGESVSIGEEDGFSFLMQADKVSPDFNYDSSNYQSPNFIYAFINDFEANPDIQKTRALGLTLFTPQEAGLTAGTYMGATLSGEQSSPILNFSGNARGNNTSTGSFTISDLSYSDDGSLASVAVDFLQYDEGDPNRWIKGALRFQSSVPIALTPEAISEPIPELIAEPIPEPITEIGLLEEPLPTELPPEPGVEPEVAIDPIFLEEIPPGEEFPPIVEIPPTEWIPLPWERWEEIPTIFYFSSGSSSSYATIDFLPVHTFTLASDTAVTAAPGPLPLVGAWAGWQSARRLRRRCQAAKSQTTA